MDSISRELNLGIQTMASRVRMMHLYYGADGHLLWTSHGTEASIRVWTYTGIDCAWLLSAQLPFPNARYSTFFFGTVRSWLCSCKFFSSMNLMCSCAPTLLRSTCACRCKVQCQTSTSVVLSSPNGDHRNLCPTVSMSFYLCRLEVPGLHMAASITSACLGHDNS